MDRRLRFPHDVTIFLSRDLKTPPVFLLALPLITPCGHITLLPSAQRIAVLAGTVAEDGEKIMQKNHNHAIHSYPTLIGQHVYTVMRVENLRKTSLKNQFLIVKELR